MSIIPLFFNINKVSYSWLKSIGFQNLETIINY